MPLPQSPTCPSMRQVTSSLRVPHPPGWDSESPPTTSPRARFSCKRGFHSDVTGMMRPTGHVLSSLWCVIAGIIAGTGLRVAAQTPPEPGATAGVLITNISRNEAKFASVFPQVAVTRTDPAFVAVAWRRYG